MASLGTFCRFFKRSRLEGNEGMMRWVNRRWFERVDIDKHTVDWHRVCKGIGVTSFKLQAEGSDFPDTDALSAEQIDRFTGRSVPVSLKGKTDHAFTVTADLRAS